jgi:hypothetical protein
MSTSAIPASNVLEVVDQVQAAIDPSSCWDQTVQVASDVGNWICDAAVHTAVWIKDAAVWLAEGAVIVFDFVCDVAVKVYTFLAPYFIAFGEWVADAAVAAYEWVADFLNKYPSETIVGAIALVVGAFFALAIERLCGCCSSPAAAVDPRRFVPAGVADDGIVPFLAPARAAIDALPVNATDLQIGDAIIASVVATMTAAGGRPDVATITQHVRDEIDAGNNIPLSLIEAAGYVEQLPDPRIAPGAAAAAAAPQNAGRDAARIVAAMQIPEAQRDAAIAAINGAAPAATPLQLAQRAAGAAPLAPRVDERIAQRIELGRAAAAGAAADATPQQKEDLIIAAMNIPEGLRDAVRTAIGIAAAGAGVTDEALAQAAAAAAPLAPLPPDNRDQVRITAGQAAAVASRREAVADLMIAAMGIVQAHQAAVRLAIVQRQAAPEATSEALAEAAVEADAEAAEAAAV